MGQCLSCLKGEYTTKGEPAANGAKPADNNCKYKELTTNDSGYGIRPTSDGSTAPTPTGMSTSIGEVPSPTAYDNLNSVVSSPTIAETRNPRIAEVASTEHSRTNQEDSVNPEDGPPDEHLEEDGLFETPMVPEPEGHPPSVGGGCCSFPVDGYFTDASGRHLLENQPSSHPLIQTPDQTSEYYTADGVPIAPASIMKPDHEPKPIWDGDEVTGDQLQVPQISAFRRQVLDAHNRLRNQHGAQPLCLCPTLTSQAQEWAEKGASDGELMSSTSDIDPRTTYGENLWSLSTSGPLSVTGDLPVQTWYEQNVFYDYKHPTSLGAAHFTQVIWKATRSIGVGVVVSRDHHHIYVVTHYAPPGNVNGQYRDNVTHMLASN